MYTDAYYVYLMTNKWRTVLYTGMTRNLSRRISQHRLGEVGSFTKKYRITDLVYYEIFDRAYDALCREKEIKGWKRLKKDSLIATMNPAWNDLSKKIQLY